MAEGNLEKDKGGGSVPDPGNHGKPMSYADRLKTNIKYDQRLKRNVLEIEIEKLDRENELDMDQACVARLLTSLGMDIKYQLKGYQIMYGRVVTLSVWCHPGVNLEKFCRTESIQVKRGIWTKNIRPAGRKDVILTVSGLDFNTPDTLVIGYIEKFGGKLVTKDVIYDKHGEGPLKGIFNGDRKYNVEFSDTARAMGTYHYLDGARIRVYYRGNTKTCGRCHEGAGTCLGGGIARDCHEGGGKKVNLVEHMRLLWQEIGFSPTTFELPVEKEAGNNTENHEGDVGISEEKGFQRQLDRPQLGENDIKKITGIQVRNFPPDISEPDIVSFFTEHVDNSISLEMLNIIKNENSLNATIEGGLDGEKVVSAASKLEFRQSKKKYFERPLYCRILKNLTPVKNISTAPSQEQSNPPTNNSQPPPRKDLKKDIAENLAKDSTRLSVKEKTEALESKSYKKKVKPSTILECGLTNTTAQQMKRHHNEVGSPTSPESRKSPKKSKAGTKSAKS